MYYFANYCIILSLLTFNIVVHAQIYRCTDSKKIIYQDKPCATQQQQQLIEITTDSAGFNANLLVNVPVIPSVPRFERNAHGRIKRSQRAKNAFKAANPCPSTGKSFGSCPGYVIDHIQALACGGADAPLNMQWQTVQEGKAKDAWERRGC